MALPQGDGDPGAEEVAETPTCLSANCADLNYSGGLLHTGNRAAL